MEFNMNSKNKFYRFISIVLLMWLPYFFINGCASSRWVRDDLKISKQNIIGYNFDTKILQRPTPEKPEIITERIEKYVETLKE